MRTSLVLWNRAWSQLVHCTDKILGRTSFHFLFGYIGPSTWNELSEGDSRKVPRVAARRRDHPRLILPGYPRISTIVAAIKMARRLLQ